MPLFWLRVALTFYGVGLVYAVVTLWGSHRMLTRILLPAVGLGTVFHLVAIVEYVMRPDLAPSFLHQVESIMAFLLMAFFFVVYLRYQTASPGVAVFPLVFLLTLSASSASSVLTGGGPAPNVSNSWIFMHVSLILVGYTALFFTFFASILYLIQERNLKAKGTGRSIWSMLPALATIDEIGYRCLVFGFPFMTLGLIAGSVVAEGRYGAVYFKDPKILISILMWVVYTILLYTRWNAGWRGRRAAYMSAAAFAVAVVALAANSLSETHRFFAQ